jgi:hypothetical protein
LINMVGEAGVEPRDLLGVSLLPVHMRSWMEVNWALGRLVPYEFRLEPGGVKFA